MPIKVVPGQTIAVDVVWKNIGTGSYAPRFRLDVRESGWATWNEGFWTAAPSTAPGAQRTTTVTKVIPSDWASNTTIDCKLMVEGIPGEVWREDDIFITVSGDPGDNVQIISVTPYVVG